MSEVKKPSECRHLNTSDDATRLKEIQGYREANIKGFFVIIATKLVVVIS